MTGALNGIAAQHLGKGAVTINTGGGDVTGQGSHYGIRVYVTNRQNDSALTITTGTGAVEGGLDGIFATHAGTGALTIETNGNVTGRTLNGINALIYNTNNNSALTITTGTGAVKGGKHGIFAKHQGKGAVTIETKGDITGTKNDGIFADISNANNTNDLKITTGTGAVEGGRRGIWAEHNGTGAVTITTGTGAVTGGQNGIFATHAGTGAVTIETNGDITGTAVAGIDAQIGDQNNTGGNGELNITANAAVTGGQYGIFTKHYGLGAVTIKTGDRDVTGTNKYGIYAEIFNANNTKDITITTGTGAVKGGEHGIFTQHYGLGAVTITTGTGAVKSDQYSGIQAVHFGVGALTIETNGDITGTKNDGIFADISNANNTNDLKITTGTGAVTGDLYGIRGKHNGWGALTIKTGGGNVTGGDEKDGIYGYINNRQNDSALTITTGTGAVKGGLERQAINRNLFWISLFRDNVIRLGMEVIL